MKKRTMWLVIAVVLLTISVGTTLALLMDSPKTVENTFTVGKVSITLSETTGSTYKIAPGVTHLKDPAITLKAESDASWLFVKVEKSNGFDNFFTYEMHDGWLPLPQNNGVYYMQVPHTGVDRVYKILKNDRIYGKDTITEEQLALVTENLKLDFTAYAIQYDGFEDAESAWKEFNQKEG